MRDSPAWKPNLAPVVPKLSAAAKLPLTWQMSFLYAVVFGGFVAFSTYLPTYLRNVYEFGLTGAGTRTAGFAIAAVIARPIGGIVADKIGPRKIVAISLAGAIFYEFLKRREEQKAKRAIEQARLADRAGVGRVPALAPAGGS